MSRAVSSRLLAARNVFATPSCTAPRASQWIRCNSSTPNNFWNSPKPSTGGAAMANLSAKNNLRTQSLYKSISEPTKDVFGTDMTLGTMKLGENEVKEPYHFHIYSHKHNTHITVTDPNRDAIISMSCGNLGLRNAQRKSYDAAYQLAAYVVDKMHQTGVVNKIDKLEVVLRGFGPGREAATKVLLGKEGIMLKNKIVRVTDSTRVKFGGTRSQRKRRLG
ncbi:hypothetical protein V8F20_007158 [Naviculisporaceae sp. PSN 640]